MRDADDEPNQRAEDQTRQAALDAWQAWTEKPREKDDWAREGAARWDAAYVALDFSWDGIANVGDEVSYGPSWDRITAGMLKEWDAPSDFPGAPNLQDYWRTHRDYWGPGGAFTEEELDTIAAAGVTPDAIYDARGFASFESMRAAGHLRSDRSGALRHIVHHPHGAADVEQELVRRLVRARLVKHGSIYLTGAIVGAGASTAIRSWAAGKNKPEQTVLAPWSKLSVVDWDHADLGEADLGCAQIHGPTALANTQFHGPVYFDNAQFHALVAIVSAQFHDTVDFKGAQFHGPVHLKEVRFHEYADFRLVQFHGPTYLHDSVFAGPTSFANATFVALLDASRARFAQVGDFRQTTFGGPLRLTGTVFEKGVDVTGARVTGFEAAAQDDTHGRYGKVVPADRGQIDMLFADFETAFRKVGKAAKEERDYRTAQLMHRYELKARRHRRTGVGAVEKFASLAYEAVSNYGESIGRPFRWGVLWLPLLFTALYVVMTEPFAIVAPVLAAAEAVWTAARWAGALAGWDWPALTAEIDVHGWWDAALLSYTNTFRPFLVWNPDAVASWNGNAVVDALLKGERIVGLVARLFATLQGFAAVVCLFLVGLALRRRFQLD